jgi:monovalent cation:H+ antiporter-2, CPA2 family
VRTFDDTDVEKLKQGGAAEIVAEVVEGSLMLATQTMLLVGVPLNKVLRRLRQVRGERYEFMRGFFMGTTDEDDPALDSRQPRLRSFMVESGAACLGKTIEALDLESLDVELTALRRRGVREFNPAPETPVQAGDVLIVAGTPEALAKAEIRLLQG